ncbi:hypothetical protein L6452_38828 [Arctium lappa]|uniref:Uncharacterized protein n=1 Tax=Arctium lappa TaxID=4217 RepID=A0ACB8XR69_ARCLA|nr:hypothetical protein L6452_38828 [Arctium lappa]
MLGVISNILAFLTTTRFGATSTPGSGNSEVKRAWVGVVPGWVTPWEVSHQVARNKSVRYTLVKSRGKADNIVVEASEMLQVGIRALFVMVNTRSRVGATDEVNEASVNAPGITRPVNAPIDQVIPPIPPMLEGIIDADPQVNLETEDPVIQEADPQSVLLASIMQMMNSAMDKRDEKLLKVLEDRDASNRRHETVEDNAVLGSGGADNAVGTEEHAVRADRGKEMGCSFKTFLCSRAPEFSGTTDPLACIK